MLLFKLGILSLCESWQLCRPLLPIKDGRKEGKMHPPPSSPRCSVSLKDLLRNLLIFYSLEEEHLYVQSTSTSFGFYLGQIQRRFLAIFLAICGEGCALLLSSPPPRILQCVSPANLFILHIFLFPIFFCRSGQWEGEEEEEEEIPLHLFLQYVPQRKNT